MCCWNPRMSYDLDCEDSVAAVMPKTRCRLIGNWLGLMKGDLVRDVRKGASR